jgi:glyoxylase-like metal-dependent hydrolase (beta-lactamase superfamily II)
MTVRIEPLAVDAEMFGTVSRIYPVLIWDEAGATLVDACYPGMFAPLRRAVEQAGVPFGRMRRVILTHQDWDHTGTLPDILAAGGAVEICAHRLEKPFIERTVPDHKLTPAKLLAFDIDTVLCYHGGPYGPGAGKRIAAIAGE